MCAGKTPVLLVLLLVALPCSAESERDQASRLLLEGNRLHDQGDYAGALEAYRQAYELFPHYKIELNISLSLEAAGRFAEAADHLARFVRQADGIADAAKIRAAHVRLTALEARLAMLSVRCARAGAAVAIDGRSAGQTPLAGPLHLDAGRHLLAVEAPGYRPFSRVLTLGRGEHREVEAILEAHESAATSSRLPASAPFYKRWWFWTIVGVAIAGGTAGGIVAATGHRASSSTPHGELPDMDLR